MWMILAALAGTTVDIEQVGVAHSGDRAHSPSTGVSILIPAGTMGIYDGEALQIVGEGAASGSISVFEGLSLQAAIQSTDEGLLLNGVGFQRSGTPVKTAGTVEIPLEGQGLFGARHVGLAYARVNGPQTVVVVVTGPADDEGSVKRLFAKLTGSLEVGAVQGAVAAKPAQGASVGPWADALRGRQLRYYSSGGGASERTIVELCSDGTMWGYSGTTLHNDTIGGASSNGSTGRWGVRGDLLTVTWSDGSADRRTLSWGSSGELLLDGSRWLRTDPERCR